MGCFPVTIGGTKFEDNCKIVQKVVEKFGGKELAEELERTGMGSNPQLVRAFHKIGTTMKSDEMFTGGAEKPQPKSLPDLIYKQ